MHLSIPLLLTLLVAVTELTHVEATLRQRLGRLDLRRRPLSAISVPTVTTTGQQIPDGRALVASRQTAYVRRLADFLVQWGVNPSPEDPYSFDIVTIHVPVRKTLRGSTCVLALEGFKAGAHQHAAILAAPTAIEEVKPNSIWRRFRPKAVNLAHDNTIVDLSDDNIVGIYSALVNSMKLLEKPTSSENIVRICPMASKPITNQGPIINDMSLTTSCQSLPSPRQASNALIAPVLNFYCKLRLTLPPTVPMNAWAQDWRQTQSRPQTQPQVEDDPPQKFQQMRRASTGTGAVFEQMRQDLGSYNAPPTFQPSAPMLPGFLSSAPSSSTDDRAPNQGFPELPQKKVSMSEQEYMKLPQDLREVEAQMQYDSRAILQRNSATAPPRSPVQNQGSSSGFPTEPSSTRLTNWDTSKTMVNEQNGAHS